MSHRNRNSSEGDRRPMRTNRPVPVQGLWRPDNLGEARTCLCPEKHKAVLQRLPRLEIHSARSSVLDLSLMCSSFLLHLLSGRPPHRLHCRERSRRKGGGSHGKHGEPELRGTRRQFLSSAATI